MTDGGLKNGKMHKNTAKRIFIQTKGLFCKTFFTSGKTASVLKKSTSVFLKTARVLKKTRAVSTVYICSFLGA